MTKIETITTKIDNIAPSKDMVLVIAMGAITLSSLHVVDLANSAQSSDYSAPVIMKIADHPHDHPQHNQISDQIIIDRRQTRVQLNDESDSMDTKKDRENWAIYELAA